MLSHLDNNLVDIGLIKIENEIIQQSQVDKKGGGLYKVTAEMNYVNILFKNVRFN